MKNQIQYVYSCTDAIFNYLKDGDLDKLLTRLRKVENHAKETLKGDNKELWFKFGEDDTLVTTIAEIEIMLSSNYKANKEFLIEQFERVTKDIHPENELLAYYS